MTSTDRDEDLSAQAAAAEVERITRRVRRRGRWPGWLWAVLGVGFFGFTILSNSGDQLVSDIVGPIPLVIGIGGYVFASRQRIVGRGGIDQKDRALSYALMAAVVVGTVIELTVLPSGFSGWLVLLAALMVVPCGIGAWRWLRW